MLTPSISIGEGQDVVASQGELSFILTVNA
jgi:hypothetical protein